MTEHVLVKEHLEAISSRQVDMPVVVIEIRAPADSHLEIEVSSQIIDVFLFYALMERSCESVGFFVLQRIASIENIAAEIVEKAEAPAHHPVRADTAAWSNPPRTGSIRHPDVLQSSADRVAAVVDITGYVALTDPSSSCADERSERESCSNIVASSHFAIDEIKLGAPLAGCSVVSVTVDVIRMAPEGKDVRACIYRAVGRNIIRSAEPCVLSIAIPVVMIEIHSKPHLEPRLESEIHVDHIPVHSIRTEVGKRSYVGNPHLEVLFRWLPVDEAACEEDIPCIPDVDARWSIVASHHLRAYELVSLLVELAWLASCAFGRALVVLAESGRCRKKRRCHPGRCLCE